MPAGARYASGNVSPASCSASCSEGVTLSPRPRTLRAWSSELTMASSLAAATARKHRSIAFSLSRVTVSMSGPPAGMGRSDGLVRSSPAQWSMRLAVLNATTISPLPLPI